MRTVESWRGEDDTGYTHGRPKLSFIVQTGSGSNAGGNGGGNSPYNNALLGYNSTSPTGKGEYYNSRNLTPVTYHQDVLSELAKMPIEKSKWADIGVGAAVNGRASANQEDASSSSPKKHTHTQLFIAPIPEVPGLHVR